MKASNTKIHIGKLIAGVIEDVGISKAEFGRRIDLSRQAINSMLNKKTLDTSLLLKISKVLNHDFFSYYAKEFNPERAPSKKTPGMFVVIEIDEKDREDLLGKLKGK